MRALSDLLEGGLDLLFAPICAACSGPISTRTRERGVCAACWARARALPLPRCDRCWTPLPDRGARQDAACGVCPDLRPAVRSIRSAFLLEGPTRAMVHALKYRGWSSIAVPMARRMAQVEQPAELEDEQPVVVPVPLAPARRRQRGYNQADLLARELARFRGWPTSPEALLRNASRGSQTTLHPAERRANVAGAFGLAGGRSIAGKHVLIVDDVWTTGATVCACADTLLRGGARAVSAITFARALPELERHARRVEALLES